MLIRIFVNDKLQSANANNPETAKSASDKQHNKEIQQIASTIRAKREVEVAEDRLNICKKNDKDSNFIDFDDNYAG